MNLAEHNYHIMKKECDTIASMKTMSYDKTVKMETTVVYCWDLGLIEFKHMIDLMNTLNRRGITRNG